MIVFLGDAPERLIKKIVTEKEHIVNENKKTKQDLIPGMLMGTASSDRTPKFYVVTLFGGKKSYKSVRLWWGCLADTNDLLHDESKPLSESLPVFGAVFWSIGINSLQDRWMNWDFWWKLYLDIFYLCAIFQTSTFPQEETIWVLCI